MNKKTNLPTYLPADAHSSASDTSPAGLNSLGQRGPFPEYKWGSHGVPYMQQVIRDELAKVEGAHCDDFAPELLALQRAQERQRWISILVPGAIALTVLGVARLIWSILV